MSYYKHAKYGFSHRLRKALKKSGFTAYHVYKLEQAHWWQQRKEAMQKQAKVKK
jgi:hypothetical protein